MNSIAFTLRICLLESFYLISPHVAGRGQSGIRAFMMIWCRQMVLRKRSPSSAVPVAIVPHLTDAQRLREPASVTGWSPATLFASEARERFVCGFESMTSTVVVGPVACLSGFDL